ncbi:hypothetical protein [Streptomyces hoynatensis]|uniref:Uncharacterized protein n=1 Tax=Streptomyces hoynatensis TaxID=1141874 RepID=A0A3A9Z2F0_9ACTN|nr:hypothetical protein [Streptomyces hoynatensis]RKN41596.1 hypothetical protein D7294_13930 [Streptomyces hoynatensis]
MTTPPDDRSGWPTLQRPADMPPTYPAPATLPAAPTPPSKPKRGRHIVTHVVTGAVCLFLGVGIGASGSGSGSGDDTSANSSPSASAPAEETPDEEEQPAAEPADDEAPPADEEDATTEEEPEEPAGPATSFSDGTYLVGEDIQAGEYVTDGPGDGDFDICYWSRNSDSSGEFESIIANGTPTGPSRVTVNEGEYFETTGCSWELS